MFGKQKRANQQLMKQSHDAIGVFLHSERFKMFPSTAAAVGFKDKTGSVRQGQTRFNISHEMQEVLFRLKVFPIRYTETPIKVRMQRFPTIFIDETIFIGNDVFRKHNKANKRRGFSSNYGNFFQKDIVNPYFTQEEVKRYVREIRTGLAEQQEVSISEKDLLSTIVELFSSCNNEPEMLAILIKYRPKLSQDAQDFLHDQIKDMLNHEH